MSATAGICPCGGHLKENTHTVTTLRGASIWIDTPTDEHLPLRVEQRICTACGRQDTKLTTEGVKS